MDFKNMSTHEMVSLRFDIEKELERRRNQGNDWRKLQEAIETYVEKYGPIKISAEEINMGSRFGEIGTIA